MNIPALALTVRSLRVSSRSAGPYAARFLFLGFTMLCLAGAWASYSTVGAAGRNLFMSLCYLDMGFIGLAGAASFATCIAEEKEEGTLGLLRMTDLSAISILLGKTAAPLINITLLLVAQVPFLLLAVTLGGVSVTQISAAVFALAGFILFVAGLGVLASTVSARSGNAQGLCVLLLMGYLMGPIGLIGLQKALQEYFSVSPKDPLQASIESTLWSIVSLQIPAQLTSIGSVAFTGPVVMPGTWVSAVGGLLFFALAWLVFDRFNRDDPASGGTGRVFAFRLSRRRTIPRAWTALPALAWKDFAVGSGGSTGIIVRFVLGLGAVVVLEKLRTLGYPYKARMMFDDTNVTGNFLIGLGLMGGAIEATAIAAFVFESEIRQQTFSTLAMLPYSIPRIAYAKVLGHALELIPACTFVLVGVWLSREVEVSELLREGFLKSGWGWFWIVEFLFGIHLVAFLSLYAKAAALPVAIGVEAIFHISYFMCWGLLEVFLRTSFGGPGSGLSGPTWVGIIFGLLTAILLPAAVFLHVGIGRRLTRLASE